MRLCCLEKVQESFHVFTPLAHAIHRLIKRFVKEWCSQNPKSPLCSELGYKEKFFNSNIGRSCSYIVL